MSRRSNYIYTSDERATVESEHATTSSYFWCCNSEYVEHSQIAGPYVTNSGFRSCFVIPMVFLNSSTLRHWRFCRYSFCVQIWSHERSTTSHDAILPRFFDLWTYLRVMVFYRNIQLSNSMNMYQLGFGKQLSMRVRSKKE